jgi:ABC-type multidrug transport system ATPase subunit
MHAPAPTGDALPPPSPAVSLLRVSQLFGSFVALRDVSLDLPAGSSVVLLGPNGAGKSTLLKLLAGLTSPTYGDVRILGQRPSDLRGRIAYMSHNTMLYDELTAPENLDYLLGLQRPALSPAERHHHVSESLLAVGLDPANPRRLGEYSQGMRQRTSLARVLLAEPDLLLLDEPFSNLDVTSAHAMITRLHTYLAHTAPDRPARTLVMTTHQFDLARPLARTVLALEAGRLVAMPQRQREATA